MDDIVAGVSALPREDKVRLIIQLIDDLDSYDWRALRSRYRERSLNHDIIGNLPYDLVHNIFARLPFADAFRLQLVCSHWRQKLTEPNLLRSLLLPCLSHDEYLELNDASLSTKELHIAILERARRVKAFVHCKPFSHFAVTHDDYVFPCERQGMHVSRWAFCTEAAVYVVSNKSIVVYYNFHSKRKLVLRGIGREKIRSVTLSDKYVGMLAKRGQCYVYDLETAEYSAYRLPSANASQYFGQGHLIVAIIGDARQEEMFVWNCNEKTLTQLRVCDYIRDCTKSAFTCAISAESNTISLFAEEEAEDNLSEVCIRYAKQSLLPGSEGMLDQGTFPPSFGRGLATKVCNDEGNQLIVGAGEFNGSSSIDERKSIRIEVTPDGSMVRRSHDSHLPREVMFPQQFWWRNIRHEFRWPEESTFTSIYTYDQGKKEYTEQENGAGSGTKVNREVELVFGNNKILLFKMWDGLAGFSFDPDLDISDAASVFKNPDA